jgi:hypothetical protein
MKRPCDPDQRATRCPDLGVLRFEKPSGCSVLIVIFKSLFSCVVALTFCNGLCARRH